MTRDRLLHDLDERSARDRLAAMWRSLRDASTWPPRVEFVPFDARGLRPVTDDQLVAIVWRDADHPSQVAVEETPIKRDG
jgi:hypothetical protein